MDQVDIYSYHNNASQPHSAVQQKSDNSTKSISYFIQDPGAFQFLSLAQHPKPSKSIKQENPSTPIPSKSTKKPIKDEMSAFPTVGRPSRQRGPPLLVPNLYAEQRVRQRSASREPAPPRQLQKDVKKIVAFGRTTAVQDFSNVTQQSHPNNLVNEHSNGHIEVATLRADLEELRLRVSEQEKLKKTLGQLQKMAKALTEKNSPNKEQFQEYQQLREELKELKQKVDEQAKLNAMLTQQISELEVKVVELKKLKQESPSSQKYSPTQIESYYNIKEEKPAKMIDNLYSCLPPSTNRKIQEFSNRPLRNLRNTSNYERHQQYNEEEITSFNFDSSQRHKQRTSFKENFSSKAKALASNQVIDLNETAEKDEFQFNEQ